jgi:hypothetical protein
MMKIPGTWCALLLLCSTAAAQADPPAQVGRLSYLSGTVSFAPADNSSEWGVAPLNRPVTTGDRVWTERDGRAEIRVGSTAIRAAALTSVDILRLDDDGTQLRLAQGTLDVNLRLLHAGDSFEIGTPGGAVLLTQPGSYRVQVDPSGATTTLLVRRGQADVLTGNAPLSVRDQQFLAFSAQGQETLAAPAPDEFDNWAAARDRQDERGVATRYVPPEMTGYEELDQHGAWQTTPEYGAVWTPTAVAAGWAPYRDGRWVWVSPWGWTWVDSAPWGFAPFHYGRWVWLGQRWAWAPGARVARPVYAPALVAFVGGSNWSVSVGAGPAVGWVPLGWREPYIPWYRHSPAYVRNVNISHVTNINVIQQYSNVNHVTHNRYVNRGVPSATTVVSRDTFVSARHVHEAPLQVPVVHEAPVLRPERQSFTAGRASARLPDAIASREVFAARAPVAPARFAGEGASGNARGGRDEMHNRPRVRVLGAHAPAAVPPPAPPIAPAIPAAPRTERHDRAAEPRPPAETARPRLERPPHANPVTPAQPAAQRPAQPVQPVQPMQPPQQHPVQQDQHHARAQARLAQQQQLQAQKEHQHQVVQQRAQEVQQQRERQFQQAQQVQQQQQQQLRQQHAREQRQMERAQPQHQNNVRAQPPAAAPARERRPHDAERAPQQR